MTTPIGGLYSGIGWLQASLLELETNDVLWSDDVNINGGALSANEARIRLTSSGAKQMLASFSQSEVWSEAE